MFIAGRHPVRRDFGRGEFEEAPESFANGQDHFDLPPSRIDAASSSRSIS